MTRLGQMIEKDGREKERIALNTLNKKLLSSNRIEDCIKATEDEEYQKRREKSLQQDKILKSMNPPKDIMDQVDLLTCSINDCWSRYADLIYQYALEDILAFLIERQGL